MRQLSSAALAAILPHATAQDRATAFVNLLATGAQIECRNSDGVVIRTLIAGTWGVGAQDGGGTVPVVPMATIAGGSTGAGQVDTVVIIAPVVGEVYRCSADRFGFLADVLEEGVPLHLRADTFAIAVPPPFNLGTPVVASPPVLTGTAEVGSVLTITPAVWSGAGSVVARLLVDGQSRTFSGLTYTIQPSDAGAQSIRYEEEAFNGPVSTVTQSNVIGPVPNNALAFALPDSLKLYRTVPFQLLPYASGGTPPYTFSATGLPTGVSIDPAGEVTIAADAPLTDPLDPLTWPNVDFIVDDSEPAQPSVAPAFTLDPVISGPYAAGNILRCSKGVVSGYPVPTLSCVWKRGGTTLTTGWEWTSTEGTAVVCEVTADNGVGPPVVVTTVAFGPITAPVAAGSAEADWLARSTAAGVVWAHDFRNPDERLRFRTKGRINSTTRLDMDLTSEDTLDTRLGNSKTITHRIAGTYLTQDITAADTRLYVNDNSDFYDPAVVGPYGFGATDDAQVLLGAGGRKWSGYSNEVTG